VRGRSQVRILVPYQVRILVPYNFFTDSRVQHNFVRNPWTFGDNVSPCRGIMLVNKPCRKIMLVNKFQYKFDLSHYYSKMICRRLVQGRSQVLFVDSHQGVPLFTKHNPLTLDPLGSF